MKKIQLTYGQFAIVDDRDYERLSRHKWKAVYYSRIKNFYAKRNSAKRGKNGRRKVIIMAREIMNPLPCFYVDHINNNTLDNRRCNLRICNKSQNASNSKMFSTNKSGYRGVSRHRRLRKWKAQIMYNQKTYFLGCYDDPIDAAKAYDKAALDFFGEFAQPNFKDKA